MNDNGVFSVHKVKFMATTNSKHKYPVAPNLLNKDFTVTAPGQKRLGDITCIPIDEGLLYLAAVEDLFHRKVVGWALNERMTKRLSLSALHQAINRERQREGLIFHSDLRHSMLLMITRMH
jgi:putative transposase